MPLKYIFRLHKNRTMTIYSILLNACKYVVYVVGLGYVLRELGINCTTYLASLSVVGLAIGFGSQGLVQDMVTGFFIIFESQFNIGDLVEIPPHVGIVDELGLRMTRLRNFNGQRVVIPNRNIATVANYGRAGLEAHVDVSMETSQSFEPVKDPLQTLISELQRQFEGILLPGEITITPIDLATGEHFAHMTLLIWPQQQWVIEQQLVPRIRECCVRNKITIPNDRISLYYGTPGGILSYEQRRKHKAVTA